MNEKCSHTDTSNKQIPENNSSQTKSVAKSTASMALATIMSRITGLMRTWMMAFALGNTVITSAYQVANNMPNVVFDLVAGGLLGAAFIPIFMLEKEKHGPQGSNQFSCNMLNLTIVVLGALSILTTIFAPAVIATQTFTVGQTAEVSELAVVFFRIFAFQILFYGISGVFSGILNSNRVYFIPAFAPAINNVCVILSFLAYALLQGSDQNLAIIILAIGTTAGVAIQCVLQIPSLIRSGFKWKPYIKLNDPALIAAIKIAIPTFIYIVGTLIAFTFRNAFSLNVAENGPSTILYAWTWYQLPYGVIAVSLSRTMFTEMSESSARSDFKKLSSQVNKGISATLVMIIPMAALMCAFATPLMSLFRAGSFNADDVATVSVILQAWVFSLPFYSVLMYLYNVYAAMRRFGTFAVVSCVAVIGQCGLYYLLTSNEALGLLGIPISDFVYYFACCVILLLVLQKRIGSLGVGEVLWKGVRSVVASVLGCCVGVLLVNLLNLSDASIINGVIVLCVCGGISLIVIFILCWLFRIKEVVDIILILKKKLVK